MTLDAKKKVREVIAAEFNGRHKGELNFDPIIVKPDVDYYGDDYYRVLVVVGGDSSLLDSAWLAGLITRGPRQSGAIWHYGIGLSLPHR